MPPVRVEGGALWAYALSPKKARYRALSPRHARLLAVQERMRQGAVVARM